VSARSEDELQADNGTGVSSVARIRRETRNSSDMAESEPEADYGNNSDMYLEPEEKSNSSPEESKEAVETHNRKEADVISMSQHFFPSFAPIFPAPPPLGHSRPSIFQEPAHSQRPALLRAQHNSFQPISFGGGSFRDNQYLHTAAAETSSNDLLGSGNFGVIRGGTFYSDDDQRETTEYGGRGNHQFFSPYYHSNNGHGKPTFYGGGGAPNPRPQQNRGNDYFANFRDFADINTPTKSSFSEYVVVYVNKNASRHDDGSDKEGSVSADLKPKNIIEQLTMLDNEDQEILTVPEDEATVIPPSDTQHVKPEKKASSTLSNTKLKLALFQDKFNKQKIKNTKATSPSSDPKDLYEPLLALS